LQLGGGDRCEGIGVLCSAGQETNVTRHGARRASRPQLKRDPFGRHRNPCQHKA